LNDYTQVIFFIMDGWTATTPNGLSSIENDSKFNHSV